MSGGCLSSVATTLPIKYRQMWLLVVVIGRATQPQRSPIRLTY